MMMRWHQKQGQWAVHLLLLMLVLCIWIPTTTVFSQETPTDLFISEYIEGSSLNKALEIYNGTGAAVDLAAGNYIVSVYFNGSATTTANIALTGTVAAGDVYILADDGANAAILAQTDQTTTLSLWNGDDAIVLRKGSTVVDSLGQVGVDPGSEWAGGGVDDTLIRNATVCEGDTDPTDAFDASVEWTKIGVIDDLSNLGVYTGNCGGTTTPTLDDLLISEYIEGSSLNKAIEIYNGTGSPVDLAAGGYVVSVYFNGSATTTANISLTGTIADGDVYVLADDGANAAILAQTNQTTTLNLWNGDDAIVLSKGGTVVDSFGQVGIDPGSEWAGGGADDTLIRNATVCAGDTDPIDAFDASVEWTKIGTIDDLSNLGSHTIDLENCGDEPPPPPEPELAFIHEIQGNGATTPLNGVELIVEAIVVGDFQDDFGTDGDLDGFYLQEENADADADLATSEGLFVFQGSNPALDLHKGDLVRVTGTAGEFGGQTQISSVTDITVVSTGNALPTTTLVTLPVSNLSIWEQYEGMLVRVQGASDILTVNDTFDLGRFGSFQLSSGGRVYIYSQLYEPTDAASFNAYHEASRLRTIVIDDGLSSQNPNPTPIINGMPFSAANTVRSGYTTLGVTGILNYSFDEYRIHPTEAVQLSTTNARTVSAPTVGGTIRVASANLLNYFNGNGMGGGFPTSRGADSFAEFERQRAKTIAALAGLNADIIGVIELENDYGAGVNSAAQDLVNGLNSVASGCPNWAYVNPGVAQIGTDEIAVGFLYCTTTVMIAPGTVPAILDDSQLPALGLGHLAPVFNGVNTNRASLAVTFRDIAGNSDITVVVNHLKSKGADGSSGLNADTGNGAGAWNQRRRDAITALDAWLATHPTNTSDDDVLLLGDLNSYAMEDPISDLIGLGYDNLIDEAGAYSYGFPLVLGDVPEVQGWGTLDYAMANTSAALQVTGAAEWHINADEPGYIDYNLEFKPAALLDALYDSDAYRAADHDPLVVGLNLNRTPTATFGIASPLPIFPHVAVNYSFTNIVDEGGVLTFEVDCTNDGTFESVSNIALHSCTYAAAGDYTVRGRITDSFGAYSEYTLNIEVLSLLEGVAYIDNLTNQLSLNQGQANSLDSKIANITRSLQTGRAEAALEQLQGLIDRINAWVAEGVVAPLDGSTIVSVTQHLMLSIGLSYGI